MDDEFTHTAPNVPRVTAAEDTDDTDEWPVLAVQAAQEIRKYAKGFLRFYRARRILSGNRNIHTVTRERALCAWQYLASLTPKDLPPTLRQPYREVFGLAYLLDREDESQSPVMFASKILKISNSIDQIVDDSLADTAKLT